MSHTTEMYCYSDACITFVLLMVPYFSQIKLSKYVAVNMVTAHAHYEPDGATYNLGNSFKLGAYYNIIKIHPDSTNEGWSEICTHI